MKKYVYIFVLCFLILITSKVNVSASENDTSLFNQHKMIAHALGGYKGKIYNNTDEAFQASYKKGFRFFETDINLTSDKKIVLFHAWNKSTYDYVGIPIDDDLFMTYDKFKATKIHGKYHTLELTQIISYLNTYSDIYFIFDVKTKTKDDAKLIAQEIIKMRADNDEILDRIVIQFVSEDTYFGFKEIYDFKYYQYLTNIKDINKVIDFCVKNDVRSVAINYKSLTKKMISKLNKKGIHVMVFTTDKINIAQKYIDYGAYAVCTNFLSPDCVE